MKASVRLSAGRSGPERPAVALPPAAARAALREALGDALTASGAAGAPVLTSIDLAHMTLGERYFYVEALAASITNFAGDSWPTEAPSLDATRAIYRDGPSAVFRQPDGTLVFVGLARGWFHCQVASHDPAQIGAAFTALRAAYPPSYLTIEEDPRVPITFWTCGNFGPTSRLRRIEAASWETIQRNYPAAVSAELSEMMAWKGEPARDGQLMIWQGPPGTGKTWALRALASEWASWAEFHYITDPDVFFVEKPSYMVDVLLADSYEVIDIASNEIVTEPGDKWRVLILEDTGELLAATAKERYGQGLSRLLNVVDGMIGQGLRVIALITTNDELDALAPAAVRPGRCLSRTDAGTAGPTVFGALSAEEAAAWSSDPEAESGSLAELYARYARHGEGADALADDTPALDAPEPVVAAADPGIVAELARIAEAHAPDGGYGDTAWHPADAVVCWVPADWSSNEEIEAARAAFLAVPGVQEVIGDAEQAPERGEGWQHVWPEVGSEAALARLIALAHRPL